VRHKGTVHWASEAGIKHHEDCRGSISNVQVILALGQN
jgi:hypothetical protein